MKSFFTILILFFSFLTASAQKKLTPVDALSSVGFTIKNFGITVNGNLTGLKGNIVINEKKVSNSSLDVTVDVQTIDTKNDRRDKHLRNEDYFETEKYPTMRIKSTSMAATKTLGTYLLKANLTIKDVTKPISFFITIVPSTDGYILSGNFEIDRIVFHIGKSSMTMGDKVKVNLEVLAR